MTVPISRRLVRRAAMTAPAAVLLGLAPVAAAKVPVPVGVSVNAPPLISLSIPAGSVLGVPGVSINLPGVLTLAVPLDLTGNAIPVQEIKIKTELVGLPPNIGLHADKLLSVSGLGALLGPLGNLVGQLSPGLELKPGSTEVNAVTDKGAYDLGSGDANIVSY